MHLEKHHSQWASRDSVPNDQLRHDIQANLLICDSLDHANGKDVEESNEQSKNETPHRELSWPNFDDNDTEDEHDHENDKVPPFWNLAVPGHETCVDIWLFIDRATRLSPYLFAEEEDGVRNSSGDRCEGQTIRYCESC